MVLETAIEDFTVRVASEFKDRSKKLFPLLSSLFGPSTTDLYDENYLYAELPNRNTGSSSVRDSIMFNSVLTKLASATDEIAATAYIMNIEAGLGDDRYGSADQPQSYIATGFEIPITSTSQIVNAEVYGGDCFVTKQVFKVNNTAARPVKFVGPDSSGFSTLDYDLNAGGTDVYGVTGEYKTGSNFDDVEILEMFIESEVNGAYSSETGVYPETKSTAIEQFNADFLFPYHPNYSQENNVKSYVSADRSNPFVDHFPARVAWSDQKVYNSNIEGFDRFRTLSVKDLEEQYGGITKLIKTSDSELWAIQDKAVRWLPVGKEVVSLDGGQSLGTVGSELVIGNTIKYLSTTSGSQHIRTVVSNGDLVFYVDSGKREVNAFASMGKIETISRLGNYTLFKDLLTRDKPIPEHILMGAYDFNKREYHLIYNEWKDGGGVNKITRGGVNISFNDKNTSWKTKFNTGLNELKNLVYSNQELYAISTTNGAQAGQLDLKAWSMYTNEQRGLIFDVYIRSTFTIIANAEPGSDKVYDVIILDAKDRVDSIDVSIEDENTQTPVQIASNIDAFKKSREGNFFVNSIRNDANKSRLRGQSAIEKITIINDLANNREVRITAILNKFRISARNL